MQISISNFRGIKDATFELGKVTVIGGENGAGKTSIAQAISSAITNECPIKDLKKADYKHLVKIGKPMANIEVKTDASRAVMQYPEGKGYTEGDLLKSSVFSVGLASPLEMKKTEATEAWITLLKAEPTLEDLKAELLVQDFGNADAIVQIVKAKGWDGALATIKEEGTKHKGRWERITNERYGTAKAESWQPEGFSLGGDENDLKTAIKLQTEAYNEALKNNAINDHDKAELEAEAAKFEDYEAKHKDCSKKVSEAANHWAEIKEALIEAENAAKTLICPGCGKSLSLAKEGLILAKETQRGAKQIEALKKANEAASKAHLEASNQLFEIEMQINKAKKAAEKLKTCTAEKPGDTAKLLDDLNALEKNLKDLQAYNEAKAENTEIKWRIEAAKILAPEGLRKRFLETKLRSFNDMLQMLCKAAEWGDVKIEMDLSVSFDEKPFALLSESEQYRTRSTIQAALATLQKADLMIFDRADLLTKNGRNGLYSMCLLTNITAIIFFSANNPSEIPILDGADKSYWVEKGELSGLIKVQAEKQ